MLKTFKIGGVHPPENKLSAAGKIQVLPIPEKVIIPLGQHIGAPATPIVQKGDKVKTGQLIAQASGFVSANIHSSVSGTVSAIDNIIERRNSQSNRCCRYRRYGRSDISYSGKIDPSSRQ